GQPEPQAALAHALGEAALAAGEPSDALVQYRRALDLLAGLDLPWRTARCGCVPAWPCSGSANGPRPATCWSTRTARHTGSAPRTSPTGSALPSQHPGRHGTP